MEIDVMFASGMPVDAVVSGVRELMIRRHDNDEDFTVTTQTEMIDVLGNVLGIVSLAVGGIGAISLFVGAIGILTIMWIAVGERTAEIGLLRAVGARRTQVLAVFLVEAALLALAGGMAGVCVGLTLAEVLRVTVPGLPVQTPPSFVAAALGLSLAVGLASGVLPAWRASRLDPVEALRGE
jgi:putative ABC transport system permease protein